MGPSAAVATPTAFSSYEEMSKSPKAPLVPGACAGWLTALESYGTLDRAAVLGQAIVLRPGSEAADARELFESFRADLSSHPIGDVGVVSVSGGVAELVTGDDTGSFVARAEAALARAKRDARGSVMLAGADESPHRQELLHAVPTPGDVIER